MTYVPRRLRPQRVQWLIRIPDGTDPEAGRELLRKWKASRRCHTVVVSNLVRIEQIRR